MSEPAKQSEGTAAAAATAATAATAGESADVVSAGKPAAAPAVPAVAPVIQPDGRPEIPDPKPKKGPRKFDENSGLGFMRVVIVLNIVSIITCLFAMLFVTGSKVVYVDLKVWNMLVYVLAQAVTVWLLATRRKYTRQIMIILLVVECITSVLSTVQDGTFAFARAAGNALPNVLLILYFATSRRAKAVLVQPFNVKNLTAEEAATRKMWNPRSVEFWMRLLIYFFVFSVVGHWMEYCMCTLIKWGLVPGEYSPDYLVWKDMFNPFFIYGIAMVFIGLLLYPIKNFLQDKCKADWQALLLSFLVNTLFVSVTEFIMGLLVNGDLSVWNYTNQPFNLMGQICLLYSLFFGAVATAATWFAYPALERMFSYVSKDAFRVIFVISLVLFLILLCVFNIDPGRASSVLGVDVVYNPAK